MATTTFDIQDWLPMSPVDGPPLPRKLAIYWPWYKGAKPAPTPSPTPTPAPTPTPTPTPTPAPAGQYTLALAAVPEGSGFLVRNPWGTGVNSNQYAYGAVVSITAQPASGYQFAYWDADGENLGNANPINFAVMRNHTVTAHFAPVGAMPTVAGPKWGTGDIIAVGTDIYTVHGVDPTNMQYLLGDGRWPNDVLESSWVSSTYMDAIATFVDHVDIIYGE